MPSVLARKICSRGSHVNPLLLSYWLRTTISEVWASQIETGSIKDESPLSIYVKYPWAEFGLLSKRGNDWDAWFDFHLVQSLLNAARLAPTYHRPCLSFEPVQVKDKSHREKLNERISKVIWKAKVCLVFLPLFLVSCLIWFDLIGKFQRKFHCCSQTYKNENVEGKIDCAIFSP